MEIFGNYLFSAELWDLVVGRKSLAGNLAKVFEIKYNVLESSKIRREYVIIKQRTGIPVVK